MKKLINVALCEGRHPIPDATDGAIFGTIINPTDVDGLEQEAINFLKGSGCASLNLYVTGLTVALIATLNACKQLNIAVTLYHFDRDSGEYFPQNVL